MNFLNGMILSSLLLLGLATAGSAAPKRIISLGPTVTKELRLLGVDDHLIGVTSYCPTPEGEDKKEVVGSLVEANVERIVSLEPDLIVATTMANRKQVEKLKSLGLNVVVLKYSKSFEHICEQFLNLGSLVGESAKASAIVEKAKAKAKKLREISKGSEAISVFVQIGAKPLFTVTGDTFINDMIEMINGENIAKELSSGMISREKVIEADPDYILVSSMGSMVGETEKKTWQTFESLKAVRNDHIYVIDSYSLCSPTPPEFVDTLEDMVELLRSEAEKPE